MFVLRCLHELWTSVPMQTLVLILYRCIEHLAILFCSILFRSFPFNSLSLFHPVLFCSTHLLAVVSERQHRITVDTPSLLH